jgi:HD superfamily phosphohydrolase YqeK
MNEQYAAEVDGLTNLILKGAVHRALDWVPPAFFVIPASTSGKYHPPQSLGKGGLIRHTVMALYFGRALCESYGEQNVETVVAALLLHDIGKAMGEPHDLIAFEWLTSVFANTTYSSNPDVLQVLKAVRWHMGPWSHGACKSKTLKVETVTFPENFDRISQIVHVADYVSSRRQCAVLSVPGAYTDIRSPFDGTATCGTCKSAIRVARDTMVPVCCSRIMALAPEVS